MKKRKTIALSGGFNPSRKSHIAMILEASKLGDVVIFLNSDEWCKRHSWNGQLFSVYKNREAILKLIPGVVDVIPADDKDDTVCKTLEAFKPDFFGNGGERNLDNTPEVDLCKKLGIGLMWYLGDSSDEKLLEEANSLLIAAITKVYSKSDED